MGISLDWGQSIEFSIALQAHTSQICFFVDNNGISNKRYGDNGVQDIILDILPNYSTKNTMRYSDLIHAQLYYSKYNHIMNH